MQKGYIPLQDPAIHPSQQHQNRQLFQAIGFHEDRLETVESQVATLQKGTSSSGSTTTIIENITSGGSSSGIPTLGDVNNQTGAAMYVVQGGDNGSLIVLNNPSGVAVTLNFAVGAPFFCVPANFGTGNVVLTPSSGTVNGAANTTLQPGNWGIAWFDGTNWEFVTSNLPTVPTSYTAPTHQFFNTYNAATGAFGSAQPAYTDISGTPTLPANTTATTHQFFTAYNSTTGAFTKAQPAYTDISGTPTAPANTAAVTSQWLNSYNASTGVFGQTQPAYTDISGTPQLAQTIAAVSHKALLSYTASTGLFTQGQLAYSDLTGIPSFTVGAYSANVTLAASTYAFIRATATAAFTITLPTTPLGGQMIIVKKVDSSTNAVTVNGNGRNIDGAASTSLTTQYQVVRMIYDSTSNTWNVV